MRGSVLYKGHNVPVPKSKQPLIHRKTLIPCLNMLIKLSTCSCQKKSSLRDEILLTSHVVSFPLEGDGNVRIRLALLLVGKDHELGFVGFGFVVVQSKKVVSESYLNICSIYIIYTTHPRNQGGFAMGCPCHSKYVTVSGLQPINILL